MPIKTLTIHLVLEDYELFEVYKFPIAHEDLDAKWNLAMKTSKILKLAAEAVSYLLIS